MQLRTKLPRRCASSAATAATATATTAAAAAAAAATAAAAAATGARTRALAGTLHLPRLLRRSLRALWLQQLRALWDIRAELVDLRWRAGIPEGRGRGALALGCRGGSRQHEMVRRTE